MRSVGGRRLGAGLIVFLVAGLLLAGPVQAGGVFSREGLGEWLEGYDMRGEALGSTGIGVIDPCNFSGANPAATGFSRHTLGYVGLHGSTNWTRDEDGIARSSTGRISGIGVHVPLSQYLAVRFHVYPRTDGAYIFEERVETGSDNPDGNIHREEGSRGLLTYNADLTWHVGRTWVAGLNMGLLAGSLLDEIKYDFTDSGWVSTEQRRTLKCYPTWTFGGGVQWSPMERVALGAALSLGTRMRLEETYRSAGGAEWIHEARLDYPAGAGVGASLFLTQRVRLSGDAYWRGWEDVELDGEPLPQSNVGGFRNTVRWGIGIERAARIVRNSGLFERLSLRLGFAWIPWYVCDSNGDGIDERRISAGIGLPIRGDRGSVDLLFSWGRRGSLDANGLENEYLRLGFACAFARVLREY